MTVETRPIEVEPRTKTVGDVLRHAALLIEERGWHNNPGEHVVPSGAFCAMGAIHFAASGDGENGAWIGTPERIVQNAAEQVLIDHLGCDDMGGVEGWNDDWPGRTAAEVIAALRAAADESDR